MIGWLKDFFLSRYMKSAIRYVLAAMIGYLVGSDIPGFSELGAFIQQHGDKLVDIVAAILAGLLATWSVSKNRINAKINKKIVGGTVR